MLFVSPKDWSKRPSKFETACGFLNIHCAYLSLSQCLRTPIVTQFRITPGSPLQSVSNSGTSNSAWMYIIHSLLQQLCFNTDQRITLSETGLLFRFWGFSGWWSVLFIITENWGSCISHIWMRKKSQFSCLFQNCSHLGSREGGNRAYFSR